MCKYQNHYRGNKGNSNWDGTKNETNVLLSANRQFRNKTHTRL